MTVPAPMVTGCVPWRTAESAIVVVGCAEIGGRGGGGVGDAVPELVPDACRWGGGFKCVEDISTTHHHLLYFRFQKGLLGYHIAKINDARDYIISSA